MITWVNVQHNSNVYVNLAKCVKHLCLTIVHDDAVCRRHASSLNAVFQPIIFVLHMQIRRGTVLHILFHR